MPIIASPMDTISSVSMAQTMYDEGGLCIFHRYQTIDSQVATVRETIRTRGAIEPAVAIGVTDDYLERATALYDAGAHILCIDVAHGHHVLVKNALHKLRKVLGDTVHIMAGNVATLEGFLDLASWGADSIRVGVGGGSICSTRIQTGHGIPTLQSLLSARTAKAMCNRDIKIIADGGIKNSGDVVKALAVGANFVMVGSLLAGTDECPGEIIKTKKGHFKAYRGMASKDAQIEWRGKTASLEGISTVVPACGPAADVLEELKRGVRSGLSYSGARNIRELQEKARFISQTTAAQRESSTHILGR